MCFSGTSAPSIQAYQARLRGEVRVPGLRVELHLRRAERVVVGKFDVDGEPTSLVGRVVWPLQVTLPVGEAVLVNELRPYIIRKVVIFR